jgi:prepilin peptidase CpaA
MSELILTLPLVLLLFASACDLRTREIPDWISAFLVASAVVAATFGIAGLAWWMVATGGLLGLLVGVMLWQFGRLGGGDAKLVAAMGTLLGPLGLLFLLFWMAIAGGLLALIAAARGQRDYAYGPAIAAGYLGYLIWPLGLLQRFLG